MRKLLMGLGIAGIAGAIGVAVKKRKEKSKSEMTLGEFFDYIKSELDDSK